MSCWTKTSMRPPYPFWGSPLVVPAPASKGGSIQIVNRGSSRRQRRLLAARAGRTAMHCYLVLYPMEPRAAGVPPDRPVRPRARALHVRYNRGKPAPQGAPRRKQMSRKPEDVIAGKNRPFTGKEYLESLRDGREVYVYGERVHDVTTHPAFRNAARSIARLYDMLHDPKHQDVLTCPTDGGGGGITHKFFRVARSREDLIGQREASAAGARLSFGGRGRPPD